MATTTHSHYLIRTSILSPVVVELNDNRSGGPAVMVVGTAPPGVGIGPHPGPGVILTPLTRVEEDGLPRLIQSFGLCTHKNTT